MAQKEDYYEILGVNKDANDKDIKKAYHKLALKYHPDKAQGDKKEAQEMFKKINEAYAILSDPDKRSRYDQYGHDMDNAGFTDFHNNFTFTDANDIFQSFFKDMEQFGFGFGSKKNKGKKNGGMGMMFDDDDDFFGGGFGGFGGGFGKMGFGGNMGGFGDMDGGFGGGFSGNTVFQSSSSFGGGGGVGKSVSSSTTIINGKKVTTTKTTISKPDGTTEVSEVIDDGKTKKEKKYLVGSDNKIHQLKN